MFASHRSIIVAIRQHTCRIAAGALALAALIVVGALALARPTDTVLVATHSTTSLTAHADEPYTIFIYDPITGDPVENDSDTYVEDGYLTGHVDNDLLETIGYVADSTEGYITYNGVTIGYLSPSEASGGL